MNIGFIGFGEAAFNIAQGLGTEGITGIRAFDAMMDDPVMGKLVHARAKEANVDLMASAVDIAKWSDTIFAAVPSSFTLGVCEDIKSFLHADKMYIDVSASAPNIKIKIWELIKDSGVLFVDAAMLGSLPKDQHKVPITASGNGAAAFQVRMAPYGMRITLAGEQAGAASAIKLVRSIYMKGIAALMIEMLEAATAYGVEEDVIASLAKSMDGIAFTAHLERLVKGTGIHCKRRAAELKGSLQLLKDKGIASDMTVAAKHRTEALEQYGFAERFVDKAPSGWRDIIDVMRNKG
jgi:3-hydroxyisobutyrate dehydrogenase-like beta-hydroxyacid dehydrogenase